MPLFVVVGPDLTTGRFKLKGSYILYFKHSNILENVRMLGDLFKRLLAAFALIKPFALEVLASDCAGRKVLHFKCKGA